jgi:beta-N-acetylhexosaminidase
MIDTDGMSLEEKVGQLMMVGFTGTDARGDIARLLTDRHVGGVILFFRNIRDGAHLTELTASLSALAKRPLLLSADQEGGSVLRIREGASLLPSAMGLGRLGPDAVREAARLCGAEMRAMGLNLNLAPVLDINHRDNPGIGIRSYGETPEAVARAGEAYVRGIQEAGTLACVKHFPGKGAAKLDAHLDLPSLDYDLARLREHELVPFKAALAAGSAAAMTSHCVYSKIDAMPATMSKKILTDLLRTELGFDGILITDDMEMGAISRYHEGTAACVAAFAAGADQILICKDTALMDKTIDALVAALKSGEVPMSRLDESLARIRRAKERVAAKPKESIRELMEKHAGAFQALCDRIVEVARDSKKQLPLSGDAVDVYWPNLSVMTKVEEGSAGEDLLKRAFAARFKSPNIVLYDPIQPAVQPMRQGRAVVFFSANAHLFPAQAKLIGDLRAGAKPFALVALRNPYDRDLAGADDPVVLSYGFLANQLKATLAVLLGRTA